MKKLVASLMFISASSAAFAGETETSPSETINQLPIIIFGETNQTAMISGETETGETETINQLPIIIFEV